MGKYFSAIGEYKMTGFVPEIRDRDWATSSIGNRTGEGAEVFCHRCVKNRSVPYSKMVDARDGFIILAFFSNVRFNSVHV